MTFKKYGTVIAFASLSVATLLLAASEASAASAAGHGGWSHSVHPMFRPVVGRPLRHHWRSNIGAYYWPDSSGYYGGPSSGGEPYADAPPPQSGDIHYTYDVPWDAVHRFPPMVAPSDKPYVPDCPSQTVSVPGHDGKEQSVTIVRCY